MFSFRGLLDGFLDELKEILRRDLNRKMIENTAFKVFENWWDEEAQLEKVS